MYLLYLEVWSDTYYSNGWGKPLPAGVKSSLTWVTIGSRDMHVQQNVEWVEKDAEELAVVDDDDYSG